MVARRPDVDTRTMDEQRRVRMIAAWGMVLATLAAVVLVSDGVGGYQYMYGDQDARYAAPETVFGGILLALIARTILSVAGKLSREARTLRVVGRVIVVLALVGPVAATQGYLEWHHRHATGESPSAQMEREAQEQFGAGGQEPTLTRVEEVVEQLVRQDFGYVEEMDASHLVMRLPSADPAAEVAAYRATLAGDGWAVAPGGDPSSVSATRDEFRAVLRADWGPTDPGAVSTDGREPVEPGAVVLSVWGPSPTSSRTS